MTNLIIPIRICAFAFLSLLSVQGADLKTYKDVYEKESQEILESFKPKFDGLQQQYQKSLLALKTSAQNQGDLTKIKAAIAEIERFQKTKTLPAAPDENALPVIKSFQSDYVKQYTNLERDMTAQLGTLTSKYGQALDRLQKDLVRIGQLDEATAVQQEREKAQTAVKDYADQLATLKGPTVPDATPADAHQTPAPIEMRSQAMKASWLSLDKESKPKINLVETDSMPLYASGTQRNEFPVQKTDDPTGPFSGKAVYFNQRKGSREVVYSVQAMRNVKQVTWIGSAMQNMTIEVLTPKGDILAKGGPYGGGNRWAKFTVTFEPSKQFLIRIHNEIRDWLLIAFIGLEEEAQKSSAGGKSDNLKNISLTKLTPEFASVGFGQLLINQAIGNAPVIIDGKECTEFLFAHANSLLRYKVPPNMSTFSAIGLSTHPNKSVRFKVVGDGKTFFESEELSKCDENQTRIRIKLPTTLKMIDLITDTCGNDKADHSVWAYPRFEADQGLR